MRFQPIFSNKTHVNAFFTLELELHGFGPHKSFLLVRDFEIYGIIGRNLCCE